MTPRVSVVIPTYQNDDFVERTVDSVLAQTYTDFELVIADHSSTDRTWELLQRYAGDPRVTLLQTPTGGGAEHNWNRVTDAARGELVKLVCGDDLLYPEALARQVEALESAGPRAVMAASSRDIVDARGATVVKNLGLRGLSGVVPGLVALRRSVLAGANVFGEPCCVLFRRSVLETIGGWHGNPGFMIDQATYCRALLEGDLVVAEGPLAAFRLSSTQWSVRLSRQQAASAAELHRQLSVMRPGLLSAADVRRGDLMAALRAAQRRLVYAYLGTRMRAAR